MCVLFVIFLPHKKFLPSICSQLFVRFQVLPRGSGLQEIAVTPLVPCCLAPVAFKNVIHIFMNHIQCKNVNIPYIFQMRLFPLFSWLLSSSFRKPYVNKLIRVLPYFFYPIFVHVLIALQNKCSSTCIILHCATIPQWQDWLCFQLSSSVKHTVITSLHICSQLR